MYPHAELGQIDIEMNESKQELIELMTMLDHQNVDRYYDNTLNTLCTHCLYGLTLMTLSGLLIAFLFTILVCIDSHAWIYLTNR